MKTLFFLVSMYSLMVMLFHLLNYVSVNLRRGGGVVISQEAFCTAQLERIGELYKGLIGVVIALIGEIFWLSSTGFIPWLYWWIYPLIWGLLFWQSTFYCRKQMRRFNDEYIGGMSIVTVQITGIAEEIDDRLEVPCRIVIKNPQRGSLDDYPKEMHHLIKSMFGALFSMPEFVYFEAKLHLPNCLRAHELLRGHKPLQCIVSSCSLDCQEIIVSLLS